MYFKIRKKMKNSAESWVVVVVAVSGEVGEGSGGVMAGVIIEGPGRERLWTWTSNIAQVDLPFFSRSRKEVTSRLDRVGLSRLSQK